MTAIGVILMLLGGFMAGGNSEGGGWWAVAVFGVLLLGIGLGSNG